MLLSEKISVIRKMNDLSQEQFAEELSVSRQAVSKWETGASVPDIKTLIKIADFYSITLDELVRDEYALPFSPKTEPAENNSEAVFSADMYKGRICDISMNSFLYGVIRNALIVGSCGDMVCFVKRNRYGFFNIRKTQGILIKSDVQSYREHNELILGKCTAYINKGTFFGGMTYAFSSIADISEDSITIATGDFQSVVPLCDVSVIFMNEAVK